MRTRWKWRLRKSAIIWLLAFALILYKLWPSAFDLKDPLVNQVAKCPGCYGQNLCPQFFKGQIELTKDWKNIGFFARYFNAKNVFFAKFKDQDVVLKKLGHDHELVSFEQRLCDVLENGDCDNFGNIVRHLSSFWATKEGNLDYNFLKPRIPDEIETFACVKSQEMIDFLMKRTITYDLKHENFLTLAFVNPEPLIAMAFPADEGWPFPKYFGACGRFSVFENAGNSLNAYLSAKWTTRARLSLQILQMALKMTQNEPIGLYLTDWSLDNFAVNENLQVKLIDLENVILVNRSMIKAVKAPGWNVEHHSVAFGCEKKCFSYSIEDVCSHFVSDHNFFGACQGIVQPLLNKDVPEEIKTSHPLFERLMNECSWPTNPGGRIEAAKQFIEILKQI